MKRTLKAANYTHIAFLGDGEHILRDNSTQLIELWFKNKNHASFGLKYKNTHLEYGRHCDKNFLAKHNVTIQ